MAHSGFQQRLRRRFTVFFLQILFQRSGVDADTDRNIFITSAVHYHANTLFITDIAWVDTQAIDAVFRHLQRDTIVEVNIGNQRDINLLFDKLERFCGIHCRYRDTNNICADAFQRFDLINRRFHICGTRIGHRLYGDGRAIADRHVPNVNAC